MTGTRATRSSLLRWLAAITLLSVLSFGIVTLLRLFQPDAFPGQVESAQTAEQLIRRAFERELPAATGEVALYTAQRVERFRVEASDATADASRAAAIAIGDLDSYLDRARMTDAELVTAVVAIVSEAVESIFMPLVISAVTDLNESENEIRAGLLLDEQQPLKVGSVEISEEEIQSQSFYKNLSGLDDGLLKLVNDAAELVPIVGPIYGIAKIFYDPRVEHLIAQPAEAYFRTFLEGEATRIAGAMEERYGDAARLSSTFRSQWSETAALQTLGSQP